MLFAEDWGQLTLSIDLIKGFALYTGQLATWPIFASQDFVTKNDQVTVQSLH